MNTPPVCPLMATSKCILYVEDDPGLRELISDILSGEGYRVETSNNGKEGLEHLLAVGVEYDLVLTDIRMPIMDGIELVRRLQAVDFRAPIILYSAFDVDLYQHETDGLRIAARLGKGNVQKLIDTVGAVIAGKTFPCSQHSS